MAETPRPMGELSAKELRELARRISRLHHKGHPDHGENVCGYCSGDWPCASVGLADAVPELLRRLEAAEREATTLRETMRKVLAHVEDPDLPRIPPNQCTLCHTYRGMMHKAIGVAALSPAPQEGSDA